MDKNAIAYFGGHPVYYVDIHWNCSCPDA